MDIKKRLVGAVQRPLQDGMTGVAVRLSSDALEELENLETALNLERAVTARMIRPCDGAHGGMPCRDRDCWNAKQIFNEQEIADLRTLVSIALWIRSEQVANVGKIIEIHDGSLRMEMSTQDSHVHQLKREMDAAAQWYTRLRNLLPDHDMKASYRA